MRPVLFRKHAALIMIKKIIKQILMVVFSGVLVACGTATEPSLGDPEPAEVRGSDCISQMSVRDYSVLDDTNLIVTGAGSRKYHVMLYRSAFDLRSTWRVGFRSPTGQICPGFSDLVVSDGIGTEHIKIRSIRALTPQEHEELLVRFGKKQPEHTQASEPEEVEGAEVEELD